MTGTEYQHDAMRTNDGAATHKIRAMAYLHDTFTEPLEYDLGDMMNAALGMSGEAGEVADMVKKFIFHSHNLDLEHLSKELGDVMWYVALMCHAIGTDMDSVMQQNIAKLKARYPEGFDAERSKNRKPGDV